MNAYVGDDLLLVQLSALLHDIGHGPFSHVSEASLARFADRDSLREDQKGEKIHELVTATIIETDAELRKLLSGYPIQNIVTLLGKGMDRRILKQVVSGPLDADKQDYLLRDSQFCGVQYGMYDLHQMQRSLVPVGEDGEEELMIDPDGVHAVEQYVLAKYYMTANVYRHRVRIITDQMIGRAIKLGIEVDRLEQMERLYRFDNSEEFVNHYLDWDDSRFMETFCPIHTPPPGKKSGELLLRLRKRSLLKQIYSEQVDTYDARIREMVRALPKPQKDRVRTQIETEIADFLCRELGYPVDPDLVIVHAYDIKSARDTSSNDEEGILVHYLPIPQAFIEVSTLFKSINAAYADKWVEVYAPVSWIDRGQKEAFKEKWKETIKGMITSQCQTERKGKS